MTLRSTVSTCGCGFNSSLIEDIINTNIQCIGITAIVQMECVVRLHNAIVMLPYYFR